MVIWSINALMDEDACYEALRSVLHPEGLKCPNGHALPPDQAPHNRHRAPLCDYRCRECGKVFNLFTGTLFQWSHYPCSVRVLPFKGIVQGTPTRHLATETKVSFRNLLRWRHPLQALIERVFPPHAPCRTLSRKPTRCSGTPERKVISTPIRPGDAPTNSEGTARMGTTGLRWRACSDERATKSVWR